MLILIAHFGYYLTSASSLLRSHKKVQKTNVLATGCCLLFFRQLILERSNSDGLLKRFFPVREDNCDHCCAYHYPFSKSVHKTSKTYQRMFLRTIVQTRKSTWFYAIYDSSLLPLRKAVFPNGIFWGLTNQIISNEIFETIWLMYSPAPTGHQGLNCFSFWETSSCRVLFKTYYRFRHL